MGHWNNSQFQPCLAFVIEAAELNQIINDLFKVTFTKKTLDTVAVHSSSCLTSLPYIVLITKDTKGVTEKPTGDGMQFGLVINYFILYFVSLGRCSFNLTVSFLPETALSRLSELRCAQGMRVCVLLLSQPTRQCAHSNGLSCVSLSFFFTLLSSQETPVADRSSLPLLKSLGGTTEKFVLGELQLSLYQLDCSSFTWLAIGPTPRSSSGSSARAIFGWAVQGATPFRSRSHPMESFIFSNVLVS